MSNKVLIIMILLTGVLSWGFTDGWGEVMLYVFTFWITGYAYYHLGKNAEREKIKKGL